MEPGFEYRTRNDMPCKVLLKPDLLAEEVILYFHEATYNHCWLEAQVQPDYQVYELLDDHDHRKPCVEISRGTLTNTRSSSRKVKGHITGFGMMECWGYYFKRFIEVPGGRRLIIQAMVAEFPQNAEKVNKWVDSYKSYYNMGKLPGCEKQKVKKSWVPEDAEYIYRVIQEDPLASLV